MDTFNYLLAQDGVDVNIQDDEGFTALMDAARWGYVEMVNILLEEHNADTTLVDKQGKTALMWANNMGK